MVAFTGFCLAAAGVFAASETPASAPLQGEYVLQPLDLVKIVVFQELDLEREVRLTQDSSISLPLIGTVQLKGHTLREAQETIRAAYERDFLVNPQITLTVVEYAKQMVNVLGAVTTAGAITIPPEQPLNLLDAIARAGGFTRLADRRHVKLTRNGDDGRAVTREINTDDIIQGSSDKNSMLRPGDVIYVPERIL